MSILERNAGPSATLTTASQTTASQAKQHSESYEYSRKSYLELESDIARLKTDRDYYQKEYLRLISQTKNDTEMEVLRNHLVEKQHEITMLRQQLSTNAQRPDPLSSRSVQSVINRSERETELLRQNLQRIKDERDSLRENLRTLTDAKTDLQRKYQDQITDLNSRIQELESENRNIQSIQGPSKNTISLLRDEINQLRSENRTLTTEITKLRTTCSQLKCVEIQFVLILALIVLNFIFL